jgi:hypothetical protein
MVILSLPIFFVRGRGRCHGLLRGLYGESDGAGKGCGRRCSGGARTRRAAKTAVERLFSLMFSIMPHRDLATGQARLTQIDPIRVLINAERRLMGTQQKSCGTEIPQLSHFNDR